MFLYKKETKRSLIEFFSANLKKHGPTREALRWTEKGQIARYSLMFDLSSPIDGKSILDFGCGFGDFYDFLKEKAVDVKYTGVDINQKFIDIAKERFPEARFYCADEEGITGKFNIIYAIGVFNLKVPGAKELMLKTLKKLFGMAKESFHFDLLSSYSLRKDIQLNYYYPEEIVEFIAKNLTRRFVLHHEPIENVMIFSLYH